MMKKHSFILWAALTMTSVFTACTNEDSLMTEQTVTKTATIHATIEGDLGSRVALTDDAENQVVKVDWAEGDAFKINVNGQDYTFTYNTATNTATKEFECNDENFPATFESAGTVTATYPATTPTEYVNQPGTLEGAAALLTMEATITVTAGQRTDDLTLDFEHKNSIVKLTLSNDDFKEKSVTGVTLKSGNTVVATATNTFTGDATTGSIVAYFAVEPQEMTNVSILAVCERSYYTATLTENKTLEAGKLYNVIKKMTKASPMGDKTASEAEKGDLAMADGTFISNTKIATLTDVQKANVAGIVFWTTADMNKTVGAQTPAKLTDDKIMAKDFPNCNHGLIVSLKDVSQRTNWQSTFSNIASWQESHFNDADKNYYKSIVSSTGATAPINYILGYQNTKILKAYNATLASGSANTVLPVSLLAEFSNGNPAPANTTGWFIPSEKELTLLCGVDSDDVYSDTYGTLTKDEAMNPILTSLGTDYANTLADTFYWSSSESAEYYKFAFVVAFDRGIMDDYDKDNDFYVRAVCAY